MNSGIEHINKNLNIEIEDIKYKLNGNNQFDIYVRSLSLLKDIKHLDKNLGLNYGGLDSFRDFVNGLENVSYHTLVYLIVKCVKRNFNCRVYTIKLNTQVYHLQLMQYLTTILKKIMRRKLYPRNLQM